VAQAAAIVIGIIDAGANACCIDHYFLATTVILVATFAGGHWRLRAVSTTTAEHEMHSTTATEIQSAVGSHALGGDPKQPIANRKIASLRKRRERIEVLRKAEQASLVGHGRDGHIRLLVDARFDPPVAQQGDQERAG
jgi:hypothetical protein